MLIFTFVGIENIIDVYLIENGSAIRTAVIFHMLRESKAPAVLIEIGFVDNTGDNNLFEAKINEIIKALAKATLEQIGVDYIESSAPTQSASGQSLYRAMVNSYSLR